MKKFTNLDTYVDMQELINTIQTMKFKKKNEQIE
jgi:hypothetical protein